MDFVWEKDGFRIESTLMQYMPATNRYNYAFKFYDNGKLIAEDEQFVPSPGDLDFLSPRNLTYGALAALISFITLDRKYGVSLDEESDGNTMWHSKTWQEWADTPRREELELIGQQLEEEYNNE